MCSNADNELGFEWILTELTPGIELCDAWNKMSWSEKENVTRQIDACTA